MRACVRAYARARAPLLPAARLPHPRSLDPALVCTRQREKLLNELLTELLTHMAAEEAVVYPAVAEQVRTLVGGGHAQWTTPLRKLPWPRPGVALHRGAAL
jgi:hypothetical protein